MGRYTVSMKPRLGAATITSALSKPQNLPKKQVRTAAPLEPEQLVQEVEPPPTKRCKVTIEVVPDDDAPPQTAPSPKSTRRASPDSTSTASSSRIGSQGLYCYKGLFAEDFPDPLAGTPISKERVHPPDLAAYMRACGPMADPDHFEAAELLMTSGLTNADKDRHLKSKKYAGKTPWKHCSAMLSDVDRLVHGPEFKKYTVDLFDGQRPRPQFMVCRDIIEIMRDFFSKTAFKNHIRYKPWRLYTSESKAERVYADMASADWWWDEMLKLIKRGQQSATIAPLIIATDQTTLSIMCGGQKAYPVYVSFGNLDKDWRQKPSKHGTYLLGYLPVDAFEDVLDDDERRRLKVELIHRAMETMLMPLRQASEQGVEMWCPDGRLRRIFPRVAAYTADWPEQNVQCCTSEGGCPICKTAYGDRGQFEDEAELREREETLLALRTYILTKNKFHLKALGLKEVWPWWGDIPDVNLSACVTPDLLHQAYQGMFKTHLVRWMKTIVGVDVLNQRFAAIPPAEGLTRFTKGLATVSSNRWTGRESKGLLAQFLPAVISGLTPEKTQMVRALVDFMYQAHATSLTESDLAEMEDNLRIFHEAKHLLVGPVYEVEGDFNRIAKLHMLRHWTYSIRQLGTPDGYNTEGPEHLHIEYAKVPWRASNKVEPLPQMVKYIHRQEAIRIHRAHLDEYLADGRDGAAEDPEGIEDDAEVGATRDERVQPSLDPEPVYYPDPSRHMAATPTITKIAIQSVMDDYGAPNIIPAITDFLVRRCRVARHNILISPRNEIGIWHKLYLRHPAPPFAPFDPIRRDVVRASPPTRGNDAAWDVALYLEKPNSLYSKNDTPEKHGVQRYRAGRVRAFFHLPAHIRFLHSGPLAYLELFAPFDTSVSPFSKLYSTRSDLGSNGLRRTLVVPVSDIVFACHLIPKFHLLSKGLDLHCHTDVLTHSGAQEHHMAIKSAEELK
ncbi:unnamed protein product [Rhizoctonia solani]|uniref:Uncharacterized protein n=1 Tax=Rhizoctonia solani TaxID=456999 RepID=A0A8H3HTN5_9AGAM|nr:unnamed protein product [Rhizoctonia solani]